MPKDIRIGKWKSPLLSHLVQDLGTKRSENYIFCYVKVCVFSNFHFDLRVPHGVDLDVLRQSHSHLIIKEYICVRPLKQYICGPIVTCQVKGTKGVHHTEKVQIDHPMEFWPPVVALTVELASCVSIWAQMEPFGLSKCGFGGGC